MTHGRRFFWLAWQCSCNHKPSCHPQALAERNGIASPLGKAMHMYVSTQKLPSPNEWQKASLLPLHLFRQRRANATLQWYHKGILENPNCLQRVSSGRTSEAKVNNDSQKILQRIILYMSSMRNAMNPVALFICEFKNFGAVRHYLMALPLASRG